MDKTYSDSEIKQYIPNVLVYSDLEHIGAERLMAMMPVAILYQVEETVGHWTLLHRTPEGVEFFDPYSYMPDQEFEVLEYKQPHYLANLLAKLQKIVPINYNEYKFQRRGRGINTCGRWVILRVLFGHMPLEVFAYMITRACEKLGCTPDQLSVLAFQR